MRRKILPILFFTITFFMVITAMIYGFTNQFKTVTNVLLLLWSIITVFSLLVILIETILAKTLFKKAGNNIDKQIFVCESILENCFVQATATICISSIFTLYLLKNDIEKAKDARARMKSISGEYIPSGLYNNYILCVYENDLIHAQIYYKKLRNLRLKRYQVQQEEHNLESLEILNMPTKVAYSAGDTFNPTGLKLKANYSDSTHEVIEEGYTCDTTTPLTKEDTKVVVSYEGMTLLSLNKSVDMDVLHF